jgi:hypothetical protein
MWSSRGIGSSIAGRGRKSKRNRPPDGASWFWLTREMIESDAWSTLSINALRVIFRVAVENMAHAGTMNGDLVITYDDFFRFGIRRQSVKDAIDEAVAHGFIVITQEGRRSSGADRWPAHYALTWLDLKDGTPALNAWKGWRYKAPIPGNIKSSTGSAPRDPIDFI